MPTFPLINFATRLFPGANLSKYTLIGCQHILGTTSYMLEALFTRGLRPERTFILGKCYSSNRQAADQLSSLGVQVSPLSFAFDSYQSFDDQYRSYVARFFREVTPATGVPCILLDDGAELLLHANRFDRDSRRLVGVEQTSSGYSKLAASTLRFPVVNVARSLPKLVIEARFIADLVDDVLSTQLPNLGICNPRVLVVGLGPLGQALLDREDARYDAEGYDVNKNMNETLVALVPRFEVIIGATGQNIFGPEEFGVLRPGTVLANIASSDREFSGVELRRHCARTQECHQVVRAGGITLLNSGFPINFSGALHSLPPERASLTRALLIAGTLQAVSATQGPGLQDIRCEVQTGILQASAKLNL